MSEVRTVGVLGAGTMGAGIAQVAAEAGLEVLLHDPVAGATVRDRDGTAVLTLTGEHGAVSYTVPEDMVAPLAHTVEELGLGDDTDEVAR